MKVTLKLDDPSNLVATVTFKASVGQLRAIYEQIDASQLCYRQPISELRGAIREVLGEIDKTFEGYCKLEDTANV
jgi:hypothetical protein